MVAKVCNVSAYARSAGRIDVVEVVRVDHHLLYLAVFAKIIWSPQDVFFSRRQSQICDVDQISLDDSHVAQCLSVHHLFGLGARRFFL